MDSKVAAVVQGFTALTPDQQDEFVTAVNRYIKGDWLTKDRIRKDSARDWITHVDLGPTSQNCPCCGR
ncbi:hypothetical protein G3I31_11060 [Streptomyces sp. SID9913]|uniref:hypothetical protein n=1 Tax=Streptomyces sp. SID9913 TaxID=2706117 RepID=UPI0013D97DCC|nr:hypothetical protein [Streptomyces sp. SID9913]NED18661.1 hypothetical protein [Streptomyces sp. SID9913]